MARANECPQCGSYVSQFAAGCSVCGADLERRRRKPRVRLTLPGGRPELVEGVLLTTLMVVVAVLAPLFGMALAALVFFDRNRRGHVTMRNLAALAFVLAALTFVVA
jgi:hypothetical protein